VSTPFSLSIAVDNYKHREWQIALGLETGVLMYAAGLCASKNVGSIIKSQFSRMNFDQ
jgi:hypothetical protein